MKLGFIKREVSKQFLKFCVVGFESTISNYLTFTTMIYFLFINYIVSFITGFIFGTLFGFVFNKMWSFESKRNYKLEIGIYFLIYLISLGIGILLLRFLVDHLNISPIVANIPVLILTTLINFSGTKIFVFKNRKW
jgi:putative flippase GtrA